MIGERILSGRNEKVASTSHEPRGWTEMIGEALKGRAFFRSRAKAPSRFVKAIEITPDLAATFNMKGYVLYCNRAARRMLGIGESEDTSRVHIADIYPARVREHVLGEGVLTAILDGVWCGETTLLNRAGEEIPVSQVIVAPLASDGRCEFLSISARDITQMKQAEERLRESEEFYRRIVQAADVGIWIIDTADRTSFANPKITKELGYSVGEMLGKPVVTFLDCEGITLVETQATQYGLEESHDFRLRRKDGVGLWVHLSTSPLFDEQEQYAGTLVIVTEFAEAKQWKEQAILWGGLAEQDLRPVWQNLAS